MIIENTTLRTILKNSKTIAIIGAKDVPSPVDMIGKYLIAKGYTVFPVHPMRKNVWGLETYKTINEIPFQIDIVNLFRASAHCPQIAQEVLALTKKPLCFWMQKDIFSEQAKNILKDTQITIVEDECIMVIHENLLGEGL